ncbi:hypothetical protein LWI28_023794 [Acer negundo]|uniref:Cupin type-1 domain-containing protein n=1 Tax=Acer negundo TaxID=4023 RepID=A0AAD5NM61_ACENE|nr:hypothetical protein LWI28_023794 [Acer negundo]
MKFSDHRLKSIVESYSTEFGEGFNDKDASGGMVKREQRKSLIRTEFGQISAVQISDGPSTGPYHLQFITLEPNSLFLPVLLNAGMVFYVRSGRGRLSWTDEGDLKRMSLKRGDVFRLQPGTVFFVESNLELNEREKLRIYAMFSNTEDEAFEPSIGAYTSISDLVLGFDKKVLASAFKVSEDVIEAITNATKPPAMIHALPKTKTNIWQLEDRFLEAFVIGRRNPLQAAEGNKNKKSFNILDAKPDFKNCNGWSLTVDKKDLKVLKRTNIGIFMVNLTKGSMMGPHWNPMANEIAVVLQGQGMVRVVCPSTALKANCKDLNFRVEEGDVFAVPRFHPMAQMSFNNDSFVFMGFSTTTEKNYPQFLAGKNSILHALNKQILALSFNVTKTTIDQLLSPQRDSVILECTSCAEEAESAMEEDIEKEKEKEKERKEEEEAKKREEEDEKREEEEAKKREEEKKRQEEEAKKREEEEAAKRAEEEAKKREEEKKRQEEEAEKRAVDEDAKKEEQAEAAAREREEEKREQEEARKREEAAQREQEEAMKQEEARKRAEEEAAREREEEKREQEEAREREEAAQREQEQEEEAQREQAEEARKRAEEEAAAREREEEKREQEEARKREEAAQREQEEAMKQEEARERAEEEAAREREEEKREQEEAREREEAAQREQEQEEEAQREQAEEARKRAEEEAAVREREEEMREQEEARDREEAAQREQEQEEEAQREQAEEARKRAEEKKREEGGGGKSEEEEAAARKREEEKNVFEPPFNPSYSASRA